MGLCGGVHTDRDLHSDRCQWVVWDCVEVFTLTETYTVTDANGFQTHFIGFGLCQCEHTLTIIGPNDGLAVKRGRTSM